MTVDQVLSALDRFSIDKITEHEFEQALRNSVQQTLRDSNFRLALGKEIKFWCNTYTILIDGNTLNAEKGYVLELIKLARNITAANQDAQHLALESKVIYTLGPLILRHLTQFDEFSVTMARVSTQAACNMVTGNEHVLDIVWKYWCTEQQPALWNQVIECNDKQTITSGLILVSQCIRNSQSRCKLLLTSTNGVAYFHSVIMEIDRSHSEESSQHFELGYIIVNELLKYGYFVDALDALQDENSAEEMNQARTVIVKILDSTLYKHPDVSIRLTSRDHAKLSDLLCSLATQACQVIQHAVTTHRDQQSYLELDKVALMYTCLVLLFQIINALLLKTENGPEIKRMLTHRQGVQTVVGLLRECETMVNWNDKEKSKLGFDYVKREIVKCIGSLCYQDRSIQDEIRACGGLPLILNQMKIDDSNPYIREYATVTLRHLLENNPENQQLIAELTPIQAVQSDALDEMGLHASLVDGKVQLEKKK